MTVKKNLRQIRTMRYFIDAAQTILNQEGPSGLTIRKVSDLAGYNSATLYSYFENLDHLAFYASLKYLRSYLIRLREMNPPEDGLELFLAIWRHFATEAFTYPGHYYNVFFAAQRFKFNDSVRRYYEIYPEELEHLSVELFPMLSETNIYKRDFEALKRCADQGYFKETRIPEINDILVLLFESYLLRIKNSDTPIDVDEHVNRIIGYFTSILQGYACKATKSSRTAPTKQ